MTHKEIVQQYKQLVEKFNRMAGQARRQSVKIPILHKVKYKKNISLKSIASVTKKIEKLAERTKKEKERRRKRRIREERRIEKDKELYKKNPKQWWKKHKAAKKIKEGTAPAIVDVTWERIKELLMAIEAGHMTPSQNFYSTSASKKHTTGRKLAEINVQKIEQILDTALQGRISAGMEEAEAKKDIIIVLQGIFKTQNVIYELERLIYGMYDREYSRWGKGMWQTKVLELARRLELVQNTYGDYEYVPFKSRGYGEVDV